MINFDKKAIEFTKILTHFNKTHKITNYNEKEIIENFYDSIYPSKFLKPFKTCIDIGSGAGFPSIGLASKFENAKFYLFEPNFKKVSFLYLAKLNLKLTNVSIISKKIQEQKAFEADLITSRAVGKTNLILQIAKEYITPNTQILLYKGENIQNEPLPPNTKTYSNKQKKYVLIN